MKIFLLQDAWGNQIINYRAFLNREQALKYQEFHPGLELNEIDITNKEIKDIYILNLKARIFNNDIIGRDGVNLDLELIKKCNLDINMDSFNQYLYREYDGDCILEFNIITNKGCDEKEYKNKLNTITTEIYNIRKNATEINNVKEVTEWLDKNLWRIIKSSKNNYLEEESKNE